MEINFEDFLNVDLRSGTVVKVEDFPRARKPAYKVWVDFGEEIGTLQSSAQVTVHYETVVCYLMFKKPFLYFSIILGADKS